MRKAPFKIGTSLSRIDRTSASGEEHENEIAGIAPSAFAGVAILVLPWIGPRET
jgi:hypothetical protein